MDHKLNYNDLWAYAPAPQDSSQVEIKKRYGLFLDGKFKESASGQIFETHNPATEEHLAEVAFAGDADVDAAVQAARRAFELESYASF